MHLQRGLALGVLTGQSQTIRCGRASGPQGWTAPWFLRPYFWSYRDRLQQAHPSRSCQALTFSHFLYNLLLWSTVPVLDASLERGPRSPTFSLLSVYSTPLSLASLVIHFNLIISWPNLSTSPVRIGSLFPSYFLEKVFFCLILKLI